MSAAEASRLFRFAAVGTLGYVCDAGILQLLIAFADANAYLARIPSFLTVATLTWQLNRRWTFADRSGKPSAREWALYLRFMLIGAAINLAVYMAALYFVPGAMRYPFLAVAAGSLSGMLFNYSASKRWVFRHHGPRRANAASGG